MNCNKKYKRINSLDIANNKVSILLNELENYIVDNISDELILYVGDNLFFRLEKESYRDYIDKRLVELQNK
jgi:hypothetical protein